MVKPGSEFYKYVKGKIEASNILASSSDKTRDTKYENTTRFLGHLLQYLGKKMVL